MATFDASSSQVKANAPERSRNLLFSVIAACTQAWPHNVVAAGGTAVTAGDVDFPHVPYKVWQPIPQCAAVHPHWPVAEQQG